MKLFLAFLLVAVRVSASPTTITDVLHQPYNGLPAAGVDVTITQTAFFNSANSYFPAWSITIHPVTDSAGNLSVQLEPNPAGQPYSVVLTYPNGVITKEFWSVPVSATPLTIKQVITTVGPTPPLGFVQLSQLTQGGAALNNVIAWNGAAWAASALSTLGLEVTTNKDAASGYAGLTAGSLLKVAEFPAFTGDCTTTAGTVVFACGSGIARTGVDINTSNQVTATHLSSALPVNQGGTGDTTLAAHGVLIGAGTGPVNVTGAGTTGQVLTSNGPNADPTYQAASVGATVQRGAYSSAPSCASSPFIFTATDAALEGRCDGSSHLDWLFKGLPVTPTVTSDLPTWFNQGGASVVSYPGNWALVGVTTSGDNLHGRYKSVPATPYSVVACMEGLAPSNPNGSFGMFWTDGTALIAAQVANSTSNQAPTLNVVKYSNATSFSAYYVAPNGGATPTGLFCLAMIDDGTNRREKISFDGKNWNLLHTSGNTDFLTATGVGVVVNGAGTAVPPLAQVVSVVTLSSAL